MDDDQAGQDGLKSEDEDEDEPRRRVSSSLLVIYVCTLLFRPAVQLTLLIFNQGTRRGRCQRDRSIDRLIVIFVETKGNWKKLFLFFFFFLR